MKSRNLHQTALLIVVVAGVYILAATLGLSLASRHSNVSPVWPPTGVAIAAVLWLGYRISPAVLIGAFVANLTTPVSAATAAGIAAGNTIEAVLAVFLLRRFVGVHSPLNRARDAVSFVIIAGIVSPAVSATIGNLSLFLSGNSAWSDFGALWLTWWLGDGSGALIIAPLLLSWLDRSHGAAWPVHRWAEAAVLALLLCLVTLFVFGGTFSATIASYPLGHLTIPFLLWAAFRFGPRGVTTAISILCGIAIWGTTRGFGPFVVRDPDEPLVVLQAFASAIAITALIMTAVITEHQRAQNTLSFLASIVESTDDAIIGKTLDGTIISWNKGAQRIYGYTSDEAVGRNLSFLIPPENADDLPRILGRLKRGEGIKNYETLRMRNDGTRIHISLTASPIRNVAGKIIAASVIARDITEVKQAEEARKQLLLREQEARAEAEAANSAKDDFLAVLSHELRTPLNAIIGWVEVARAQPDNETVSRALEVIKRNGALLTRIIEDILDVSRIVSGKLHLEMQPVNLSSCIRSAVTAVQPGAEQKGVLINAVLDPAVLPVIGDAHRLQQIVWNLLSNAIKFTPPGGTVDIALEQIDAEARITVSDTGDGILPEVLPRVFDRFRQADSSRTRRHGGLGLGLAIAKNLTELHKGRIEAHSDGPGRGASFTVTLSTTTTAPATASSRPKIGEPPLPADGGKKLSGVKLLIVDDDPDSLEVLANVILMHGGEVKLGASVREALHILDEWTPNVLISDIGMPLEDGYELIRRVRAKGPEQGGSIPAIALTGYAGVEEVNRALRAGYQVHLAKPIDETRLLDSIADLIKEERERCLPDNLPVN